MKHAQITTWAILIALLLTTTATAQEDANINLIPHIFYQNINPCETAKFTLDLVNTGAEQETYELTALNFQNQTTIEPTLVALPAETTQQITITTRLTDCAIIGRHTIPIQAVTETSQLQLEIDLTLDISSTGVPIIAPTIKQIITKHSKTTASLPVSHKDNQTLKFSTKLEGEPWMSLAQPNIQLEPTEQKTLTLILDPDTTIPKGNYHATITLTGSDGKQYKKTINIQLGTTPLINTRILLVAGMIIILFVFMLIIRKRKQTSQQTTIKKITTLNHKEYREQRREEHKQKIQARQAFRETYYQQRKKTAKKETLKKQTTQLSQTASEKLQKTLEKEIKKQLSTTHHLIPKTAPINPKKTPLAPTLLSISIILFITAIALTAYQYQNTQPYIATASGIIFTFIALRYITRKYRRTIRNSLIIANELTHLPTSWHMGLTKITITPQQPLKNLAIKIRSNKGNAHRNPNTIYTYASIRANHDLIQPTFTFHIPQKWLAKNNANKNNITLWHWNGIWKELPITTTPTANTIKITTTATTGTFALGIKTNKQIKTTRKAPLIGYASLAVLALLTTILITPLIPQQEPITHGIPQQTWPKNTDHTLELKPYFNDPDGDKLTYTATKTPSINIKIINSKAILSPDSEFIGTREVIFTAHDNKNGTANSNTVKLTVVRTYLPTHFQPYARNLLIITIILLIITTLVAFRQHIAKFLES